MLARTAGGILIGLTSLFIVMNVAFIVTALTSQTPVGDSLSIWIADFTVVIPTSLVGGILLWL